MKEVKMRMGRREECGDCLASCMQMTWVLCSKSEEDLNVMAGCFVEVCRRKGLKVNADKGKVVLGSEEELGCDIYVDGTQLEQVFRVQIFGVCFG